MLQCGTDKQTNEQLKIELLSQWKLEAEFRNFHLSYNGYMQVLLQDNTFLYLGFWK